MIIGYHPGNHGTPTDNTSPIGGTEIDFSTDLDQDDDNLLISDPPITSEDDVFYGIGNFTNEDSQKLANARVANRNAMKLNSFVGIAQAVSTSTLDLGDLLLVGKLAGNWIERTIELNGKIPVFGDINWDALSVYRCEYLIDDVPTNPRGNITLAIGGETVTIMFGGNDGISLCSAEYEIAIAEELDVCLVSANRKTAPEGIGDFSRALKFPGSDESLVVPTGELLPTKSISWVVKMTVKGNIPRPKNIWTSPYVGLVGNPQDV